MALDTNVLAALGRMRIWTVRAKLSVTNKTMNQGVLMYLYSALSMAIAELEEVRAEVMARILDSEESTKDEQSFPPT